MPRNIVLESWRFRTKLTGIWLPLGQLKHCTILMIKANNRFIFSKKQELATRLIMDPSIIENTIEIHKLKKCRNNRSVLSPI